MNTLVLKWISCIFIIFLSNIILHAQTPVNLSTHFTGAAPTGTIVEWHTNNPPNASNLMTTAQANAALPGTYYATFYDSVNNCYSPTTKVKVITNTCPITTVNLNSYTSSTPPIGTVLQWHTSRTPSVATLVVNPALVGVGTYFATYYDAVNNCYSPVSSPIIVTQSLCNCYNPVTNVTAGIPTKEGFTLLKRAGDTPTSWPMSRSSGHLVLESNTKGLVITRIANPSTAIVVPQEGMIVYDTVAKCLKIYSDGAWNCFSTPACP